MSARDTDGFSNGDTVQWTDWRKKPIQGVVIKVTATKLKARQTDRRHEQWLFPAFGGVTSISRKTL